jgi:23S rRNA maturation mini-RNase III
VQVKCCENTLLIIEEYIYESKTQNICDLPFAGDSIFEWYIFKINHNFLDVLTRRYESYHKKLKENINKAVPASDDKSEVQKTVHRD